MYTDDHAPPHFHAEYGEYDAMYEIRTLEVYAGRLPRRIHRLIVRWASLHGEELLKNWELAQDAKPVQRIEPLR